MILSFCSRRGVRLKRPVCHKEIWSCLVNGDVNSWISRNKHWIENGKRQGIPAIQKTSSTKAMAMPRGEGKYATLNLMDGIG